MICAALSVLAAANAGAATKSSDGLNWTGGMETHKETHSDLASAIKSLEKENSMAQRLVAHPDGFMAADTAHLEAQKALDGTRRANLERLLEVPAIDRSAEEKEEEALRKMRERVLKRTVQDDEAMRKDLVEDAEPTPAAPAVVMTQPTAAPEMKDAFHVNHAAFHSLLDKLEKLKVRTAKRQEKLKHWTFQGDQIMNGATGKETAGRETAGSDEAAGKEIAVGEAGSEPAKKVSNKAPKVPAATPRSQTEPVSSDHDDSNDSGDNGQKVEAEGSVKKDEQPQTEEEMQQSAIEKVTMYRSMMKAMGKRLAPQATALRVQLMTMPEEEKAHAADVLHHIDALTGYCDKTESLYEDYLASKDRPAHLAEATNTLVEGIADIQEAVRWEVWELNEMRLSTIRTEHSMNSKLMAVLSKMKKIVAEEIRDPEQAPEKTAFDLKVYQAVRGAVLKIKAMEMAGANVMLKVKSPEKRKKLAHAVTAAVDTMTKKLRLQLGALAGEERALYLNGSAVAKAPESEEVAAPDGGEDALKADELAPSLKTGLHLQTAEAA